MKDEIKRLKRTTPTMKGHVCVELIENGQTVRKIEKDNLVTNAVDVVTNSVIGSAVGRDRFMPIPESVLGGLMLFDDELEASAENTFFPIRQTIEGTDVVPHLVGYAGRDTNTTNVLRGSLITSQGQTGPTGSGYRSVWEFGTTQAIGQIKAVALTYGTSVAANSALAFKGSAGAQTLHSLGVADAFVLTYDTEAQEVYYTSGITRSAGESGNTYTVPIYKVYLPVTAYKVADAPNAIGTPTQVTTVTIEGFPNVQANNSLRLSGGGDGYVYAIATLPKEEGEETYRHIRVAKISVQPNGDGDYDFATTTEDVDFPAAVNLLYQQAAVCSDGVFYAVGQESGAYKLYQGKVTGSELATVTISLPQGYTINTTNVSLVDYMTALKGGGLKLNLKNGSSVYFAYVYPDGQVVIDGEPYSTSYGWDRRQVQTDALLNWYGGTGYITGNYLGTIANLPSAVNKGDAQVFRVTYTLTDGAPPEEEEE